MRQSATEPLTVTFEAKVHRAEHFAPKGAVSQFLVRPPINIALLTELKQVRYVSTSLRLLRLQHHWWWRRLGDIYRLGAIFLRFICRLRIRFFARLRDIVFRFVGGKILLADINDFH